MEQWRSKTMDQDAFRVTQFRLTSSILPAETRIPDFSMTMIVYPSIYIPTDFKKITDFNVWTRKSW